MSDLNLESFKKLLAKAIPQFPVVHLDPYPDTYKEHETEIINTIPLLIAEIERLRSHLRDPRHG